MFERLDNTLVGTREDRKQLLDTVKQARESQGIEAKKFETQEIFERALYPLVNAGFKAFEKALGGVIIDSRNDVNSDAGDDNNANNNDNDDDDDDDDDDKEYDITMSPDELDLMFVKECGFPSKRGGPFFWAEKDKSLQEI